MSDKWKKLQRHLAKERRIYRRLAATQHDERQRDRLDYAVYVLREVSRQMRWLSQEEAKR